MTQLSPGFADPVLDAQASFRAILDAMSRPGRIQRIAARITPPAPLCTAAGAALLSLADADTPLWLDAGAGVAEWLRFHCGAPITGDIGSARFALACGAAPSLEALDVGTDEDPQLGATLILQVAGLVAGVGWCLTGPGIQNEHRLRVLGAPADFITAWAQNHALFPRGVDVLLCAGDSIAALPRSVTIAEG
ncbi:MAG: phosphonate C-P lyase system protein PhnH [Roseomonas sp.]|nr:phosphonate C-P lyase system protein PhnH [Roseomonas sp.]MCA3329523.1 phosphonate C-P lyase system protein PhnH [Roseomonas sp.]MCA3333475.1 phosphonate C-P lyase system protein PhnH [Roseomonas sp.]MCA3354100.1 phosphonate C-P lyase system protein PhnH [Roseomonas sp.]MCA3361272.1 phosphonate C-P lyase system protein PhnH [Roseomonas sp.]